MFKWKKNVETKDRQKRKGKEGGRACARPQRHLPHPQRESAPDCRLQSKSLRGRRSERPGVLGTSHTRSLGGRLGRVLIR